MKEVRAFLLFCALLSLPCFAADAPAVEKTRQSKKIDGKSQTKVLEPTEEDIQQMANAIASRLKQTTKDLHIDNSLCCEVRFRARKNKSLLGYTLSALSDCETFNAAVFEAIYLACNQNALQASDSNSLVIEYSFFITPD